MKILLTGATGFIGKHLYKRLIKESYEVIVYARSTSDTSFVDKKKVLLSDQNNEALRNQFSSHDFDGIIHLAALYINQHKPDDIENLIQSNVLLGTQVLEMAKANNVSWFINSSTFFQHFDNEEYNPVNLYAATKQAFEAIAKYYYETTNLNFVTLKLNDTYGPYDSRKKIFNLLLEYADTNKELKMSPGEQIMEMVYIDDVIDGFLRIIEIVSHDEEQAYCGRSFSLPSEERMSLKKFVSLFEKITGKSLIINWGALNYRPREVMKPTTIIEPLPSWKQKVFFKEGLKITILDK